MTHLDIGEVVERTGIPASTLRYYEEKGLIAAAARRGLRRQYDPAVLDRQALIKVGREAGFSLDDIAGMFAPDGRPRIDRRLLSDRADDLDRTIRRLRVLRNGLRHAADCAAPSHLECPTFRSILAGAFKGERSGALAPDRSGAVSRER